MAGPHLQLLCGGALVAVAAATQGFFNDLIDCPDGICISGETPAPAGRRLHSDGEEQIECLVVAGDCDYIEGFSRKKNYCFCIHQPVCAGFPKPDPNFCDGFPLPRTKNNSDTIGIESLAKATDRNEEQMLANELLRQSNQDGLIGDGLDAIRAKADELDRLSPIFNSIPFASAVPPGYPSCPEGCNIIVGSPTGDTLYGTSDCDCIFGLDGDDIIYAMSGDDLVFCGDGDDIAYAGPSARGTTLYGESGQDELWGGNGHDLLWGGDGADLLVGRKGDDELYGGPGNDQLKGGPGEDKLFGEEGRNTLSGEGGKDELYGGQGPNVIYSPLYWTNVEGSDATLDSIYAEVDQIDVIVDMNGHWSTQGCPAGYKIEFIPEDSCWDGKSYTPVQPELSESSCLIPECLDQGVYIQVLTTRPSVRSVIFGTPFNDIIKGTSSEDVIYGLAGDDELHGLSSSDILYGGSGSDALHGGSGADTLYSGHGDDLLDGGSDMDALYGEGNGLKTYVPDANGVDLYSSER